MCSDACMKPTFAKMRLEVERIKAIEQEVPKYLRVGEAYAAISSVVPALTKAIVEHELPRALVRAQRLLSAIEKESVGTGAEVHADTLDEIRLFVDACDRIHRAQSVLDTEVSYIMGRHPYLRWNDAAEPNVPSEAVAGSHETRD